jgi:hypothetical protein
VRIYYRAGGMESFYVRQDPPSDRVERL